MAFPAISQPASMEAAHSPAATDWTAVAVANGPARGHLARTGICGHATNVPPYQGAPSAPVRKRSDSTLVDRELDRSGAARAEHQAAAERARPGVAWQPDAEQACWAVGVQDGPPPAACNPVPGAALDAVNWARNVNIHEIQAANGGG